MGAVALEEKEPTGSELTLEPVAGVTLCTEELVAISVVAAEEVGAATHVAELEVATGVVALLLSCLLSKP